jgi:hypothetical protein
VVEHFASVKCGIQTPVPPKNEKKRQPKLITFLSLELKNLPMNWIGKKGEGSRIAPYALMRMVKSGTSGSCP